MKPIRVLLVCRANQCRSPLAAAIATSLAPDRRIRFDSAGLLTGGHPVPLTGRRVARRLGYDLEDHRSRAVQREQLEDYDLILAMARDQSRDLLVDHDARWSRLFTLKQFTRWLDAHPRAGVDVGTWLDATAGSRSRRTVIGADLADDIADPLGMPAGTWRDVARELDYHLRLVVAGLTEGSQIASTTSRS